MSRSATDFSCSDPTYNNTSEDDEQAIPEPTVQPHNPSVVGTPAPEKSDEQQDDIDSS